MNLDHKYQRFCQSFNFFGALNALKRQNFRCFAYFEDHPNQKKVLFIGHNLSVEKDLHDLNTPTKLFRISSLSYELKNSFEKLNSENKMTLHWPDILSFEAHTAISLSQSHIEVDGDLDLYEKLLKQFENHTPERTNAQNTIDLNPDLEWETYQNGFRKVQASLQHGDIYELNYCVNASFKGNINPIETGFKLLKEAQATFMAIANFDGKWILSGSPERFLKKTKNKLISQPIKGTAKRGADNEADKVIAEALKSNPKERSENIMIVDLVRNDLSRLAKQDSVKVEELCELYSFKTVHQLISTISCDLKDGLNFEDILKATFPMGSMTGAPKVSAMKLIDEYESFRRSHYSGSLGYQSSNDDFDFNVLIRSIFYDERTQVGMAPTGGAITIESDCQKEYEEVLLKMTAMQNALQC